MSIAEQFGTLGALTYAHSSGIGQKVDCSLFGGDIRLMGWTLTTAMWRNCNPVPGQPRLYRYGGACRPQRLPLACSPKASPRRERVSSQRGLVPPKMALSLKESP